VPVIELINLFIESYSTIPLFYSGTSVFSLFYILLSLLLIRNYRFTGSFDYLLIAGAVLGLMVNLVFFVPWFYALPSFLSGELQAVTAFSIAHLVFYVSWTFVLFFNYLWAIRVKWSNPHPVLLFLGFAYLIIFLLIDLFWLFDLETYYLGGWDPLLRLLREVALGLSCSVFVFAFLTTERVSDYKTAKIALRLWLFSGAVCGLRAVVNISMILLPVGVDPFLLEFISLGNNYILVVFYFIFYTRYPECLLITEVQAMRACKIYAAVKAYPDTLPTSLGMDKLKQYVDAIPESLWDKGCG
jgi:hypothetical protein